jgi:hypothetical protein
LATAGEKWSLDAEDWLKLDGCGFTPKVGT